MTTQEASWRHHVKVGGDSRQTLKVREDAVSELANAAAQSAFKRKLWADEGGARSILLEAAGSAMPPSMRGHALRGLSNLAATMANLKEMAHDATTRALLVDAAMSKEDELRVPAINALANLSYESANTELMWSSEVSAALLAAAAVGEPEQLREHAMRGLAAISSNAANRTSMWTSAELRNAFLRGAAAEAHGQNSTSVRASAMCGLANLTAEPGLRQSMWQDGALRTLMLSALSHGGILKAESGGGGATPKDVQEHALRGMANLSKEASLRSQLLRSSRGLLAGLTSMASSSADPSSTLRGRKHAISALANLALSNEGGPALWNDAHARRLLLTTASPHNDTAPQPLREEAFRVFSSLTSHEQLHEDIWSVPAVQKLLLTAAEEGGTPAEREHARKALSHILPDYVPPIDDDDDEEVEEEAQSLLRLRSTALPTTPPMHQVQEEEEDDDEEVFDSPAGGCRVAACAMAPPSAEMPKPWASPSYPNGNAGAAGAPYADQPLAHGTEVVMESYAPAPAPASVGGGPLKWLERQLTQSETLTELKVDAARARAVAETAFGGARQRKAAEEKERETKDVGEAQPSSIPDEVTSVVDPTGVELKVLHDGAAFGQLEARLVTALHEQSEYIRGVVREEVRSEIRAAVDGLRKEMAFAATPNPSPEPFLRVRVNSPSQGPSSGDDSSFNRSDGCSAYRSDGYDVSEASMPRIRGQVMSRSDGYAESSEVSPAPSFTRPRSDDASGQSFTRSARRAQHSESLGDPAHSSRIWSLCEGDPEMQALIKRVRDQMREYAEKNIVLTNREASDLNSEGTLHVLLSSANGLLSKDSNGLSDPYVKLRMPGGRGDRRGSSGELDRSGSGGMDRSGHGLDDSFKGGRGSGGRWIKSKTIRATLNPTWHETFTARGILGNLIATPLQLKVFDYDWGTSDDYLGQASIDINQYPGGYTYHNGVRRELTAHLETQGTVHLQCWWEPASKGNKKTEGRCSWLFNHWLVKSAAALRVRVFACLCGKVLHPDGRFRSIWNVMLACFILYCGLAVPLEIAFEQDMVDAMCTDHEQRLSTLRSECTPYLLWFWGNFVVDVWFICDIIINFRTGYVHEGHFVNDDWLTAKAYLKGSFTMDVLGTFPLNIVLMVANPDNPYGDPLITAAETGGEGGGDFDAGRANRMLRLLRMAKLAKLARMAKLAK